MSDKRLIEVAFPLEQVSLDSVHEKNVRHGHISTLHIWPARRPLAACGAALIATLTPDPGNARERQAIYRRMAGTVVETVEDERVGGRTVARRKRETQGGILHWKRGTENEPDLDWFRARIREAYDGRAPRVLDPFAGGGAIPLEAMRLGCEVTAVDLNPVAWFILKCTLDYPHGLAGETRPLPNFALRDRDFMAGFLTWPAAWRDGSWPIQTERLARTRAMQSAALASSIWIVCRKRPAARPGWDTAVLTEMRENISQQLRDFWDAGIRGPDFVWAATGPALEAFSKYPAVKRADDADSQMTVSEFLRAVRRFVVDFVVGRVLTHDGDDEATSGLDDVTTYYLLHRNDFGLGDAPIGACILYAISCNLSDRDLTDRYDVLSRGARASDGEPDDDEPEADEDAGAPDGPGAGSRVRLKSWSRRTARSLGYRTPDGRPPPLIDQAHRLMHFWRAAEEAKVNDYLDDRGLKRHALFARLLQALIELAAAGSDERTTLESLSNHIAARGGVAPARQPTLQRLGEEP